MPEVNNEHKQIDIAKHITNIIIDYEKSHQLIRTLRGSDPDNKDLIRLEEITFEKQAQVAKILAIVISLLKELAQLIIDQKYNKVIKILKDIKIIV